MKNHTEIKREIAQAVASTEALIKAKIVDQNKANRLINLAHEIGKAASENLHNIPNRYKNRDDVGTAQYITLLSCLTPTNDPQWEYISKVLSQQVGK